MGKEPSRYVILHDFLYEVPLLISSLGKRWKFLQMSWSTNRQRTVRTASPEYTFNVEAIQRHYGFRWAKNCEYIPCQTMWSNTCMAKVNKKYTVLTLRRRSLGRICSRGRPGNLSERSRIYIFKIIRWCPSLCRSPIALMFEQDKLRSKSTGTGTKLGWARKSLEAAWAGRCCFLNLRRWLAYTWVSPQISYVQFCT